MTRPSTIDELPDEIRSEIGRLRTQGATIDRIVEHLRTLHGAAPSRSAVGRHVKKMAAVGERMRRSRDVAEAVVRELGNDVSKTAQLNIELVHTAIFDLFNKADDDMEMVDSDGKAALAGNPEGVMFLARALDHLTKASKTDVEYIAQREKRAVEKALKEAAAAVEVIGRKEGLTATTLQAIKAGFFGVKA